MFWVVLCGLCLFVGLMPFHPIILAPLMFLTWGAEVAKETRMLRSPETYTVVGETLALYCQSYQGLRSGDCGAVYPCHVAINHAWTPKVQ
jgi:hypothetical protein